MARSPGRRPRLTTSKFSISSSFTVRDGRMTIYLTHRGGDEAQVDEIEGKLKSAIPDLKRVPRVEDIDPKSINGADRSIVLLVAGPQEHANVDHLIDIVRRHPRNL